MYYKGFYIDRNIMESKFTVWLDGEAHVFRTMMDAFEFINSII